MRAVLTRVNSASVAIDGEVVGKIGKGFLILLGVGPNDTEKECRYLAEKALGLRIFTDENDKMNLGLDAVGGRGAGSQPVHPLRQLPEGPPPQLHRRRAPGTGEPAVRAVPCRLRQIWGIPPQHGRFGADMKVESVNDGPVTLILDTEQLMDTPRRK